MARNRKGKGVAVKVAPSSGKPAKGAGKGAGKGSGKAAGKAAGSSMKKMRHRDSKQELDQRAGGTPLAKHSGGVGGSGAAGGESTAMKKKKNKNKNPDHEQPETVRTPMKSKNQKRKQNGKELAAQDEKERGLGAKCKGGHIMEKRTENPKRYLHLACCDVCGLDKLVKKRPYFFHCSFCKFDTCPKCAEESKADGFEPEHLRKKRKMGLTATGRPDRPAPKAEGPESGFTRARREIWLPTDATAVSRMPLTTTVARGWVEGVPL